MRHSRNMFADQPPRRFENAEAAVHVALRTEAVGVFAVGQEGREVVVWWAKDDAGWRDMAVGTVVVLVAVEASDALEEYVDGAEVGYEQVGVDVERLFERLGADDDAASWPCLPLPSNSSIRLSSIARSQAANRP